MKTLYLSDTRENIVVDPEEDYVGKLTDVDRYIIKAVYQIKEPMRVVYQYGEFKQELSAKKGELLVMCYSTPDNVNRIFTIKSKEWNKNIDTRIEREQKQKEEWAARNAECELNGCDPCCDNCEK